MGNWLFGVASRVSLDARAALSRRRLHERRYAECRITDALAENWDGHDVGAVLHEELRRLPERYRAPIVLCYLEGLTHEEAALRWAAPSGRCAAGWPEAENGSEAAWQAGASFRRPGC